MRKATALVVLASVGSTLLALQAGLTWPGWTLLITASWMGSVKRLINCRSAAAAHYLAGSPLRAWSRSERRD